MAALEGERKNSQPCPLSIWLSLEDSESISSGQVGFIAPFICCLGEDLYIRANGCSYQLLLLRF
jgi:hypothetical protein